MELFHKLLLQNDLDLFIKRLILFFDKKTDKTAVYHYAGHCWSKVEQIIALIEIVLMLFEFMALYKMWTMWKIICISQDHWRSSTEARTRRADNGALTRILLILKIKTIIIVVNLNLKRVKWGNFGKKDAMKIL